MSESVVLVHDPAEVAVVEQGGATEVVQAVRETIEVVAIAQQGPPGSTGNAGTAATISIGTVTTGAAGSSAAVSNAGTANAAILNFTIPRGNVGPQGDAGREVEIQAGATHLQWRYAGDAGWTNLVALSELTGPPGDPGDDGDAATISIGTVTTGAAGSSAAVSNAGTANAAILNFTIPRGNAGDPGDPGREVELQTNATHLQWRYVGDVSWTNLVALSLLQGPPGNNGDPGLTERTVTFGIRETTTGDRADTAVILPFGGTITKWKLYSETAQSATLAVKKNGTTISGGTVSMTTSSSVTGDASGWSADTVAEDDVLKISVAAKSDDALLILVLVIET
ncbi:MAG TPA: hypothetical protein PLX39_15525 [Pyrinomonadaceae bacterium]|mgnify:CR=1 FL=1|nr:hypothetical protein [Pyrinomonadaceae bacterium]